MVTALERPDKCCVPGTDASEAGRRAGDGGDDGVPGRDEAQQQVGEHRDGVRADAPAVVQDHDRPRFHRAQDPVAYHLGRRAQVVVRVHVPAQDPLAVPVRDIDDLWGEPAARRPEELRVLTGDSTQVRGVVGDLGGDPVGRQLVEHRMVDGVVAEGVALGDHLADQLRMALLVVCTCVAVLMYARR